MNIRGFFVGITAALIAIVGPSIFIIDASTNAGFSNHETISWIFIVYFNGGMLSLLLSLKYKIPLIGAHSLTAAAFLATAAVNYTLPELVASYIFAGIILIFIGLTGVIQKVLDFIPVNLINAMLAGLILNYLVQSVHAFHNLPFVGIMSLIGFLMTHLLTKKIPSFFGALIMAFITLFITHPITIDVNNSYILPMMVQPEFSLLNIFSLSLPIVLLILSGDSLIAISALKEKGYNPPVNQTIMFTGVATSLSGLFGGHASSIGGMTTTLCASDEAGEKDKRYMAALTASIILIIFGLLSPIIVSYIVLLPTAFISIIAGFSLLTIQSSTLYSSFGNSKFYYSTVFTFIVALSGVNFFHISAPVWAILVGILTTKVLKEGEEKS